MMVSIGGLFVALFLTGIIGAIAWWQWNSYVTLDQRIETMDASLLDSAGTRIEKVLDAPQGSVTFLLSRRLWFNQSLMGMSHIRK